MLAIIGKRLRQACVLAVFGTVWAQVHGVAATNAGRGEADWRKSIPPNAAYQRAQVRPPFSMADPVGLVTSDPEKAQQRQAAEKPWKRIFPDVKAIDDCPAVGFHFARKVQQETGVPIHPRNKRDGGERLALWALARDSGKTGLVSSGPFCKGITIDGNKAIISFDCVGSGLMVGKKDGRNPAVEDKAGKLSRFAIAGADKKWFWADAEIDGDTVLVSSPDVPSPAAVRYGFSMNPEGCNPYNEDGLPASAFRADNW